MGKQEVRKDIKQALEKSVDDIGEATKNSTQNIFEVMIQHGFNAFTEYFDKGISKIKKKIGEGFNDGETK
ncbi:MAG: hypothetical protein ACTSWJ_10960 [Candidatus Heimdallarchaeaceae archaeon]